LGDTTSLEGPAAWPTWAQQLFERKSLAAVQREASHSGLTRSLGPVALVLLGVGNILGAGIYVMTGTAAANFAGPAVILSFLIAAGACGFTGLCYAELAAAMPVSGSSYTYCYAALGQMFAWILGWLVMLEYTLAASALAVGLSSYLVSLLHDFGVIVPAAFSTPALVASIEHGHTVLHMAAAANLLAAGAIALVALILTLGVTKSSLANTVLVIIKVAVLLGFVAVGFGKVDPKNWTPFIPPNEGGFAYGWPGVIRAASILFFAFIGFESVSTASCEARRPQRDIPIGILGSLVVCTVLYLCVGLVLTGLVPYRQLGVADPIAIAVDTLKQPIFAEFIKIGALTGLASVLLVNGYGQSRICYAMGRDGLLPEAFTRLHTRFKTPFVGSIILGLIAAVFAAFLPISILGDMVSLGTALAFTIVCLSVMWLRGARPDLERPFRVPLGGVMVGRLWLGVVPTLGIILCWGMIIPVVTDVVGQAARGDLAPSLILAAYCLAGAAIYIFYGLPRTLNAARRLASASA
jgi:APA family basic amino acid/polyamine antiporter